jgi:hypothetical protein
MKRDNTFSFSNASLTGLVDRRTGWDSLESAIAEDLEVGPLV